MTPVVAVVFNAMSDDHQGVTDGGSEPSEKPSGRRSGVGGSGAVELLDVEGMVEGAVPSI